MNTIVSYNTDGLFRIDAENRETMNRQHGEETDSGQGQDARTPNITIAFEDEILYAGTPEESDSTNLATGIGRSRRRMPPENASILPFSVCLGGKHVDGMGAPAARGAREVFYSFSEKLDWDLLTQADVLLNFCGDGVVEVLLQDIEDTGQTADFEEFLLDNFGEEWPEKDDAERPD
ncbi:MAG: hypothetical protein LLG00_11065 [Planctomycetaceae bacterium]|nr:hypothetical protein [Planctomycetaceae bacterium]